MIVRGLPFGYVGEGSALTPLALLLYQAMQINVLFGVFNLIPIPPLDGSHVIRHFLSAGALRIYDNIGIWGLVIFMFFGGRFLGFLLYPVLSFFNSFLLKF